MAITEVHILHHTHVDVGYTDLQPVIWDKHVQYLEQVLDYCRASDGHSDDAQFRWVCEFTWPMLQFFRTRPERAAEMAERLRQGRVELAGLFLDPTELMDKRAYEMALVPAQRLAAEHGFDLTTVMTTDVPGAGWSLPDVMAQAGLPYLSVSPNAMVSKPLQIAERPFWWVGPRGGRALVWHTDWRKGWYGACHVLGMPQGLEVFGPRLLEYLRLLESEGYPYQPLLLHYAADNYPPSAEVAGLVQTWNDEVGEPRLRLSTNRTFFERLIELHGDDFPTHQLAWPDWWSEGLGSAAYEAGLARETHCRLRRIEALQGKLGDTRDLWPIWEDLLLFDEHTWGCSNMGTAPHSYQSRASWVHKARHIYLAHDRARRLETELTLALAPAAGTQQAEDFRDQTVRAPASGPRRLSLYNPLPTDFHGPISLAGMGADVTGLRLSSGAAVGVQSSAATALRPTQSYAAPTVPAHASILAEAEAGTPEPNLSDGPVSGRYRLQTDFLSVECDAGGRLLSLVDRVAEREMLDTRAPWGFGEVIRETITSPEDRAAVWERGYSFIPYAYRRSDANFAREGSLSHSRVVRVESGPVFDAVIVESELPYLRRIETELRVWRELPWIEFEVRLDKQAYENYEGVYVAFPFKLEGARAFVHSCDAVFEAEAQQLPGTCRDYYAVQDYAALANDDAWAAVCPVEAPLMQLGALTFGRWADHLRLDRACLYSWLTNNFWYTNFPGYQLGELTFRFAIVTGSGALDHTHVQHLAEATRVGVCVAAVE
jgi:alpha-mannosidase